MKRFLSPLLLLVFGMPALAEETPYVNAQCEWRGSKGEVIQQKCKVWAREKSYSTVSFHIDWDDGYKTSVDVNSSQNSGEAKYATPSGTNVELDFSGGLRLTRKTLPKRIRINNQGTIIINYEQSQIIRAKAIEKAWPIRGYASFETLNSTGKSYSLPNVLFLQTYGSNINIFDTYKPDPTITRCGGLGCDLAKGSYLGSLTLERLGHQYVIRRTTGSAQFLLGAKCEIEQSYLDVLNCQVPGNSSIFSFSPET